MQSLSSWDLIFFLSNNKFILRIIAWIYRCLLIILCRLSHIKYPGSEFIGMWRNWKIQIYCLHFTAFLWLWMFYEVQNCSKLSNLQWKISTKKTPTGLIITFPFFSTDCSYSRELVLGNSHLIFFWLELLKCSIMIKHSFKINKFFF